MKAISVIIALIAMVGTGSAFEAYISGANGDTHYLGILPSESNSADSLNYRSVVDLYNTNAEIFYSASNVSYSEDAIPISIIGNKHHGIGSIAAGIGKNVSMESKMGFEGNSMSMRTHILSDDMHYLLAVEFNTATDEVGSVIQEFQ